MGTRGVVLWIAVASGLTLSGARPAIAERADQARVQKDANKLFRKLHGPLDPSYVYEKHRRSVGKLRLQRVGTYVRANGGVLTMIGGLVVGFGGAAAGHPEAVPVGLGLFGLGGI